MMQNATIPVEETNALPEPETQTKRRTIYPSRQGSKTRYRLSTFVSTYDDCGKCLKATAKALNVSANTVTRYLRKAGVYESKRKSSKRVTIPVEEFVRLRCAERLTLPQIAARLDVSEKTVCKRLRQAGIKLGKMYSPRRELYLSLHQKGLSNKEIAEQCGVIEETVRQMLLNCLGGAKGTRKLSAKARRYLELFAEGFSIREISEQCGTAYVTVAKSLRLHGAKVTTIEAPPASNILALPLPIPTFSIKMPSY
jgi:DNA-binding CsgD family transcriptional regulator/bacterioferritin-associated ferredoxin